MYSHLYIHIPFCSDICDFCNLYAISGQSRMTKKRYLIKIINDIKKNHFNLREIKTVFIGGGTPLSLREEELEYFFSQLRKSLKSSYEEFTVECHPKNTNEEKLKILLNNGVNRLSFGVQSHLTHLRQMIGRKNSNKNLSPLIKRAKKLGFSNINIDLIYGIPDQTLNDWYYDLEKTLNLGIQHLSAYSLSVSPQTKLFNRNVTIDDDQSADFFMATDSFLKSFDFVRYEVSNFSLRKIWCCQHNLGVWKGETYLGLGAGAVSFDGKIRWQQSKELAQWFDDDNVEEDRVSDLSRSAEIFFTGLRTIDGWTFDELLNLLPDKNYFSKVKGKIIFLRSLGLVNFNDKRVFPTKKGILFADTIAEELLI